MNYSYSTGRSPVANFGKKVRIKGQPPSEEIVSESLYSLFLTYESSSIPPLSWEKWDDVTSTRWMGLSWSSPEIYGSISSSFPPKSGVYKTWYPNTESLEIIDVASNIANKLKEKGDRIDNKYYISYSLLDIEGSPQPTELEVDLAGIHYLAKNRTPELDDMKSMSDRAESIIERDEDNVIEIKEEDADDDDIVKEAVALANGGGGEIFLGISDGNLEAEGIEDIDEREQQLTQKIKDKTSPSLRIIPRRPKINDTRILWISVPDSPALYSIDGKFYIRSGSTTDKLEWNDIENYLKDHPDFLQGLLESDKNIDT